jgi:hypothetical protein
MASPIYGVRLGLGLGQPSRYMDSHNLVSWAKSRRTREELGFYFQKKKRGARFGTRARLNLIPFDSEMKMNAWPGSFDA